MLFIARNLLFGRGDFMIQIALCDDDRVHIAQVEALLNEYFADHTDIRQD